MGGCLSGETPLQRLGPGEESRERVEEQDKHVPRGDSAVSKGTSDSGVVMENKVSFLLPGGVPVEPPPERVGPRGLSQSPVQGRLKSSEILEELHSQGIIPGQSRVKALGPGEVFSIMLNDSEEVRRKPPARLESLKTKNTVLNREEIDQKMKQAEERRKSQEDKLKTRLRSARVRHSAPNTTVTTEQHDDTFLTPVEPLQSTISPDLKLHTDDVLSEDAEGGEGLRQPVNGCERDPPRGGAEENKGTQEAVKEDDEVTKVEEFI